MQYVLVLSLLTLINYTATLPNIDTIGLSLCFGCVTKRGPADLWKSAEVLNESLTKLAVGGGPYYKLVKIKSASVKLLHGIKHTINADLEDEDDNIKNCDIEILKHSWLKNDIQVTLACSGERKLIKTHSP